MTVEQIRERLTPIFHKVMEDETLVLTDELTAHDVEDWNSLSNVELMGVIVRVFKIKMEQQRIDKLQNVGELIVYIQQQLK